VDLGLDLLGAAARALEGGVGGGLRQGVRGGGVGDLLGTHPAILVIPHPGAGSGAARAVARVTVGWMLSTSLTEVDVHGQALVLRRRRRRLPARRPGRPAAVREDQ